MKKIRTILPLLFFIQHLHAQIPSSCVVPLLLKSEYKRDVVQLATKRLHQLQSPDTALVQIPNVYTDSIFGGLAAIFNATSLPERDTIFNLYCVHNLNGWPYNYSGYLIKVDTSFAWTNAWQSLNTVTGDPLLDTITARYDLTVTNFFNWGIGSYALLATDSFWNTQALLDSFLLVNGIVMAELDGIIGAAGIIDYNVIGNARYYNFYFEFADCFDGCDNFRKWKFKVNADCSVDYLGVENWSYWNPPVHPFPAPVNCNTFTGVPDENGSNTHYAVFPNPTNGKLFIELAGSTSSSMLTVYSILGEVVYTSAINQDQFSIDLSHLAKGVYFIAIDNKEQRITKKIVLE